MPRVVWTRRDTNNKIRFFHYYDVVVSGSLGWWCGSSWNQFCRVSLFSLFNRHRTNPKIVNRFLDDDNVVRFHSVVHSHSRNQLKNSFEWKQQREKKSPERWDYVFNTGGPFCVIPNTNQTKKSKIKKKWEEKRRLPRWRKWRWVEPSAPIFSLFYSFFKILP